MPSRRGFRTYIAVAAVFLILIVWVPHTSIPTRSQEYIAKLKLLPNSNGWQLASGDATPPPPPEFSLPPEPAPEHETLSPHTSTAAAVAGHTSTLSSSPEVTSTDAAAPLTENDGVYNTDKWFFEYPQEWLPLPKWDTSVLTKPAPRNWKGPGRPAFATFYASRNATMWDPYCLATQQVIYRTLWMPKTRSKEYPIVVFVPPFVSQEARDAFASAGAIVREVQQHHFVPNGLTAKPAGRLKDVFSKLEMWSQTDFSMLAYLDSDAFPIENIDGIFEAAPPQTCKPELMKPIDQPNVKELCNYTLAGYPEGWHADVINAGVMVFNPNQYMYDILMREMRNQSQFDNGFVEQALISLVYRHDGPFPAEHLPIKWNGSPDVIDRGEELRILHGKIWSLFFEPTHWAKPLFNNTWYEMYDFYSNDKFVTMRQDDDLAHSASYGSHVYVQGSHTYYPAGTNANLQGGHADMQGSHADSQGMHADSQGSHIGSTGSHADSQGGHSSSPGSHSGTQSSNADTQANHGAHV